MQVPVMIVGVGADRNTPTNEIRAMNLAVQSHGELHILEGLTHVELGSNPPAAFKQALLAFLDRNLK